MSSNTSNFHKSKQSAAVLKHAIINSYATPFASKTGGTSKDNRVAFIDGYAGPGRYKDDSEGSGAMLLRKAKELAAFKSPRTVECHFVEDDEESGLSADGEIPFARDVTLTDALGEDGPSAGGS